ncbi:hypothetical protein [Catenuloplanes atrovinosus]|uniref:Uncharacterized protein n=1 Tax=Catenuloplanes atrovinosus TaxID=137266 RepID=A0AAE3YX90_9ACTN|nr:hypothetical protein [Catenuloplanes atrovinosus]MDR7280291.1 hypothetical protein [Catenuloplanes atrovinosus]
MRRFLDLIVKRLLRSRAGVAIVLFAIVLLIVGVARGFSGNATDRGPTVIADGTATVAGPSIDPSYNYDGPVSSLTPPTPSTSPGGAQPDAVGYAFAAAWVDHQNTSAEVWYDRLLPHATESLAEKLRGVDPVGVPADRITGDPVVVSYAESVVDVTVPVDSGTLRLTLVAPDGHWLVDSVDWERA